jgi:hypothetical protein
MRTLRVFPEYVIMRYLVRSVAAVSLAAALFASSLAADASRARTVQSLPVFKPIMHDLATVRIPVFLPSWLPNWGKVYPYVSLYSHRKAFEVDLTVGPNGPAVDATNFWIVGNLNPLRITTRTKKVKLSGHRTGYLEPNIGSSMGTTLGWKQYGYVYMIGKTGKSSDLIKAADSLVRVH